MRSIAIFCACLAMSFGLLVVRTHTCNIVANTNITCTGIEIVVFSPARRASRKLLERIVEFIRLAGGDAKICEYNQACNTTTLYTT